MQSTRDCHTVKYNRKTRILEHYNCSGNIVDKYWGVPDFTCCCAGDSECFRTRSNQNEMAGNNEWLIRWRWLRSGYNNLWLNDSRMSRSSKLNRAYLECIPNVLRVSESTVSCWSWLLFVDLRHSLQAVRDPKSWQTVSVTSVLLPSRNGVVEVS